MEPERDQHQPEDAWESLPIDFLIKILKDHLPISTLLECRSVCKKWKEIIDGPELRNNIWKKSVIGFIASRETTAYFCCRDRWITRNLTFRPNELVAADGGLLCFGEPFSTTYIMYNPVPDKILPLNVPREIDGEHTVIHGMLECKVVGLVVDQSTKNFKLVLGGVLVGTYRRRTLIYDSTTGTWSWGIQPFPERMKDVWVSGRSVECNRCMYWLVWNPFGRKMKALLIFDLEEGTWNAFVDESMEAAPIELQIAAYESHVCLLASNWSHLEGEFHRWSNVTNFFRNPMVRRMDGALIKRFVVDQWVSTVFNFYATGGSDEFFVFDEEGIELEVVKYSAEFDLIFFLPQPPFHSRNGFQCSPIPEDPWCAIIPSPRGSAGQGWITQQEYIAQQQERRLQEEMRG